jgi:hypothetical protein
MSCSKVRSWQLGAELPRDHRRGVGVDRAVDGHHQPLVEQLLQHVLHALFELVGEIFTVMPSTNVMVRVTGGGGICAGCCGRCSRR